VLLVISLLLPPTIISVNDMNKCLKTSLLIALQFVTQIAIAEIGVSKDWIWSTEEEGFYYAITMNSKEHILGQYCYLDSGVCIYMVGLNITCQLGSTYPSMVNSDKGAVHVSLECSHRVDGQNVLAVREFSLIDAIVRKASHIGFVIPMENDKFKVARFSLMGSSDALDQMRAAAKRAIGIEEAPEEKVLPDEEIM
jgi:hypothetical protein